MCGVSRKQPAEDGNSVLSGLRDGLLREARRGSVRRRAVALVCSGEDRRWKPEKRGGLEQEPGRCGDGEVCSASHAGTAAFVVVGGDRSFAARVPRFSVRVWRIRGVVMAHVRADVRVPRLALGKVVVDDRAGGRKQQD